MNATARIIQRAVEEAAQLGDISSYSTGQLLVEVASRLQPNMEVKMTGRRIRVQHTGYFDNLYTADGIDSALAQNRELFA